MICIFDHYQNKSLDFLDGQADVLVLAGDIHTAKEVWPLKSVFTTCAKKYSQVVYVPGNHEFYNTSPTEGWANIHQAAQNFNNVHVLYRSSVEIMGKTFIGDTLWFKDTVEARIHTSFINDFAYIKDFVPWVYEEQQLTEHYLDGNLKESDILVTRHLPVPGGIAPMYQNSVMNCYFLCDIERLIERRKPAACLFGHTHTPCDFMLGDTRIVTHPRGYPRERPECYSYQPKLIEIK